MTERRQDWKERWAGGPGNWGPAPTTSSARNGLALLGLVMGGLACVLSVTVIGGAVLGVLAMGFSAIGLARVKAGRITNGGRVAVAGLLVGALALILSAVILVTFLTSSRFHHYTACRKAAVTTAELNACGGLSYF